MSDSIEKHDLISKVKDLAIEIGRTPKRDEFDKFYRNAHFLVKHHFGSYTVFIQAAGLDPVSKKKKIDNSVFEFKVEQQIQEHWENKKEIISPHKPYPTIAVLGDLHEPFSHQNVKADFVSFVEKEKPEYVMQVGDSFDAYAHSKFPRSHNIYTPKKEEELARKHIEELWSLIKKASPKSKCVMLIGNHCLRALKRVLESAPTIEHWAEKYFQELMTFEGVHTQIDPREEYIIGDIAFLHGYRSKLGDHRDYMLMNAVVGHTHLGGVSYRQIKEQTLWELNAGFAGDPTSKALSYTNQKMSKSTLGFAYIDKFGPRFIHY